MASLVYRSCCCCCCCHRCCGLLLIIAVYLVDVLVYCYAVNDGINADAVGVAASVNQLHGCTHETCVRASAGITVVLYQYSCVSSLSSDELLKQLHWLPIEWRIWFKLATVTFKALHTGRPPYLSDLLQYHESTRSLHSSNTHQLLVPLYNVTFGSRAFRFSIPRVWNSLPGSICESQSLPTFRPHLKTYYFQSAYPPSAAHLA